MLHKEDAWVREEHDRRVLIPKMRSIPKMKAMKGQYLAILSLAVGGTTVVLLDELTRDVAVDGVRNPYELSLEEH